MDINESTMSSNHNCLNFCNRRSEKVNRWQSFWLSLFAFYFVIDPSLIMIHPSSYKRAV